MKKLVVCLFVLLMLVGCGSKKEEETVKLEAWEENLIEAGKIYVATSPDYPPFETLDEKNNIVGFDIDLFEAVVSKIEGYEVVWEKMEFDTIVSAVQTGNVDFGVSGFSYDPEKQVLFTDTYYDAGQTVLVLADSGYKTVGDLKGLNIAAQTGTTCAEAAKEYIEDVNLTLGTDAALLVNALKANQYDGVCLDTVVALNYVNADSSFAILDEAITTDAYSMIAKVGNEELLNKINDILVEFVKSQEYQDLIDKWGM